MIPFVVIGHPRSGSTLLKEAIDAHPVLKVYGELFHKADAERQKSHCIRKQDGTRVHYEAGERDAIEFLTAHVWSQENSAYQAVGFKLFFERIKCPGSKRLFARLKQEITGLRVIHIIRDNLLDSWVSRKKAEQTGVWRLPATGHVAGPTREIRPIHANPENILRNFEQLDHATQVMARTFRDIPYLAVNYATLVRDFQKEMSAVFCFLDASPIRNRMSVQKQNTAPHRDFISNYDELKEFFANTPYSGFFRE
jgi:LPS sulfotransferase NodH